MMPLDTPIRMENGAVKALGDVALGDRVRDDLFGYINTVTGLERCAYSQQFVDGVLQRRMYSVNGLLRITGTHHMRAAGSWAMVEFDIYDSFVRKQAMTGELITANGVETAPYLPLATSLIVPFGPAISVPLPRFDASVVASELEEVTGDYQSEDELGALRVDGSHVIEAGGFFVSGWAHDQDFDYELGQPK